MRKYIFDAILHIDKGFSTNMITDSLLLLVAYFHLCASWHICRTLEESC